MKKYIPTFILIILDVICVIAFNVIGSEVLGDGTLVEPFFLIPIAWLIALAAIITGVATFVISRKRNSKINGAR